MTSARRKFAHNLRWLRRTINLDQGQLALCVGVHEQTVSNWECGRRFPSACHRLRLREVFGDTALLDVALLEAYEDMREEKHEAQFRARYCERK
jgi:transcriptional regulator with XRE-family HTH domain